MISARRLPARARWVAAAALLALAGLVARGLASGGSTEAYRWTGATMGTTYSVLIDAESLDDEAHARIDSAILGHLDEVNRLMSTYDAGSEVSRFNAHAGTDPFPLSAATLEVLALAETVSRRSDGAFDVTVAPLVNAWGFGPGDPPDGAPPAAALDTLLARVGWETVHVRRDAGTASKDHPETVVDLSGIAKGYAVDRVAGALEALGWSRYLVEVGGEIRAGEARRDGTPWRVGVERPASDARSVYRVVELTDAGIATSGDYRNVITLGGERFAHLLDPRTARPVPFVGASVSVVHERAAVADAWATALAVLGPDAGMAVAEREGVAALFIVRRDDGFDVRATSSFDARLRGPETEPVEVSR